MYNIEKLDNELYMAVYGLHRIGNCDEIWSKIKSSPAILREAVQVKRDKFNERDIVKGLAIADAMLIDYKSVDCVAYNELINLIYTNRDVARIVLDGASNGGYSFLLMSLWNHDLKLSDEQKAFAVDEAMNKFGTVRWQQGKEKLLKELDDMGISDDNTTFINIDGCVNPIGQKTALEYMNYMFSTLSDDQAHGKGAFDIRYYILRNPNWSLEEKKKLIMDFWCDDETYDEYLEQWEWGIINDYVNYECNPIELFNYDMLYEYSYNVILNIYEDKEIADRIWQEIQFCKLMHELRPQQWEIEFLSSKKRVKTISG